MSILPESEEFLSKSFVMGRMTPPHLGHKHLIDYALSVAKEVYLFLGVASEPTEKNPLYFELRKRIIEDTYKDKVKVLKDPLCADDKVWLKKFKERLRRQGINLHSGVLVGHMKPNEGYLTDFHKYNRHILGNVDDISSTEIRKLIREGREWRHLSLTQNVKLLEEVEAEVRKF